MTKLSVNLNKAAYVRNTRDLDIPNVVRAARVAIESGAQGITVHPRPDRRHIRPEDVFDLKAMLTVEFNIEGNPFPEYMDIVRRTRPDQCTLVPDEPGATTSDHGWNLDRDGARVEPLIQELRGLGCRVSLFMDPEPGTMRLAREVGADRIELYTEPYARAFSEGRGEEAFAVYRESALAATEAGLGINAGHDLNLDNLVLFRALPNLLEVSIGHALMADALFMGLGNAVRAYREVLAGKDP